MEPDLSIVILNYNVKDLLINCLNSIFANKTAEDNWQIIVVDNASADGSSEEVKKLFKEVELIESNKNLGFSGGNNLAVPYIKAPIVLFLNPDTEVVGKCIQKTYEKLLGNPNLGAITCRVELPDGKLDYSCHRGFPTPWNSFTFFSGLSRVFPKTRLFAGYTAKYLDIHTEHVIDCATGAFLMVRTIAAAEIGWWDTDYFWNGEDIEFCYSLKEKGWQIYYYPFVKIIHFKGSSSGLWNSAKEEVGKDVKIKSVKHALEAMRIFYKKHFYYKYPPLLRDLILAGIGVLEHYRKIKIHAGLSVK